MQQPNNQAFKDSRPLYTKIGQQMAMTLSSLGHTNNTYGFISQSISPITIKLAKIIYRHKPPTTIWSGEKYLCFFSSSMSHLTTKIGKIVVNSQLYQPVSEHEVNTILVKAFNNKQVSLHLSWKWLFLFIEFQRTAKTLWLLFVGYPHH